MLKQYIASFEREIWQRREYFFRIPPRSKIQTVLGHWHSSLDPQFIWICPWLGWKAICVETLYSEFLSAEFEDVESSFFVYHQVQEFSCSQTVLRQWHSSLDPQFFWICPWLGWKAICVETLYCEFLGAKFEDVESNFSYTTKFKNFFVLRLYSESDTPP